MDLREKTLKDIEGFFKKKSSSIESICFFMQKLRLLLEIDDDKRTYKIVNHYCNWLFHKKLDRNTSEIIENIGECFECFENKNELIMKISSTISIKKLIIEIKEILHKNKIGLKYNEIIENDNFWISFTQNIFYEIKNRPIIFENKKNITSRKIDNFNVDFSVYGIQLFEINNKIVIEILSNELEDKSKNFYVQFILTDEK